MAGVKVDLFVVVHVSNYAQGLEKTWQQTEMIKYRRKSGVAKGENSPELLFQDNQRQLEWISTWDYSLSDI